MNIFSEYNFGLYEEPEVESLDPLLDPFKQQEFNDYFWDTTEIDTSYLDILT